MKNGHAVVRSGSIIDTGKQDAINMRNIVEQGAVEMPETE